MPGSFIDTNVLLYLASRDEAKARRAEELLSGNNLMISVQVLNELANVTRRKMQLTWEDTHRFLSLIRRLVTVQAMTIETHEIGLALAERYGLSLYDALIGASALQASCDTLWSEDMQDGLVVDDRLRIRNPFSGDSPTS